jgi:hypothetical protein
MTADWRRLEAELQELERTDPKVKAARERLDQVVDDVLSGRAEWRRDMLQRIYGDSGDLQ